MYHNDDLDDDVFLLEDVKFFSFLILFPNKMDH